MGLLTSNRPSRWILSAATFVLLLIVAVGCQKRPSKPLGDLPDDATNQQSPFDDGGETGPSLQSSGTLTESDKAALSNLKEDFEDVQPEDDGQSTISQALAEEMERLVQAEKEGQEVAVQKIALAGKMMAECANRIASLAPFPGQPLLGDWAGKGCPVPAGKFVAPGPAIGFAIDDPAGGGPGKGRVGKAPPAFKVHGGTNGVMAASPDGEGAIQGEPWAGKVSDTGLNGRSGAGTVVNPKYSATKYGHTPCSMGVSLAASRNPIPENYVEGMRIAGKCFRQTLFLMSPTMDQAFKRMDPQLAAVLKARMLGLGVEQGQGQGQGGNGK